MKSPTTPWGACRARRAPSGLAQLPYSEPREGYKNIGRLTSVLSPETSLTIDYDDLGRVRRQVRGIAAAGYAGEVAKTTTTPGGSRGITYPDNDAIGPFTYDGASRLASIPGILDSVSYDAAGRPLVQTNANGTVTTRTYLPKRGLLDLAGRPTRTGTIQNLELRLRRQAAARQHRQELFPGESWGYRYDDGYRMDEARSLSDPADIQTFDYDALGRIRNNSRVGPYEYPAPGQPRPHADLDGAAVRVPPTAT